MEEIPATSHQDGQCIWYDEKVQFWMQTMYIQTLQLSDLGSGSKPHLEHLQASCTVLVLLTQWWLDSTIAKYYTGTNHTQLSQLLVKPYKKTMFSVIPVQMEPNCLYFYDDSSPVIGNRPVAISETDSVTHFSESNWFSRRQNRHTHCHCVYECQRNYLRCKASLPPSRAFTRCCLRYLWEEWAPFPINK